MARQQGSSLQGSSRRRRRRRRRRRHHHSQRQARSRTARAQLTFSVGLVERHLREGHYAQHLSETAPVFLASTLEYLTATVLELAGNEARYCVRRRITPELLDRAIHNNALVSTFFGSTTISQVAPARH